MNQQAKLVISAAFVALITFNGALAEKKPVKAPDQAPLKALGAIDLAKKIITRENTRLAIEIQNTKRYLATRRITDSRMRQMLRSKIPAAEAMIALNDLILADGQHNLLVATATAILRGDLERNYTKRTDDYSKAPQKVAQNHYQGLIKQEQALLGELKILEQWFAESKTPLNSAAEAIRKLKAQWNVLVKPGLNKKQKELARYIEPTLAMSEKLSGKQQSYKQVLSRVDDTLSAQERKTLILYGTLDDLKKPGQCWAVQTADGFKSEIAAYLDPQTGKLLFMWIIPEG